MTFFDMQGRPWLALAAAGLVAASGFVACVGDDTLVVTTAPADGGSSSGPSDAAANVDGGSPASGSDAAVADGGADVDAAPPRKRIFVTTGTRDGKFNNLKGADDYCKEVATQAQVGGVFIAFMSVPGANAIDRLIVDGPWYSMDRDTLLFTGKRTGANPVSGIGPAAPIVQNEIGQAFNTPNTWYWTGTSQGGQASTSHCDQWTNVTTGAGFAAGTVGSVGAVDKAWTEYTPVTCYSPNHVLCFEQ